MSLIHNERTKLTATWINGLGTAFIAAAMFAPLAALFYGLAGLRIARFNFTAVLVVCFAFGLFLHWVARLFLGRLRE